MEKLQSIVDTFQNVTEYFNIYYPITWYLNNGFKTYHHLGDLQPVSPLY